MTKKKSNELKIIEAALSLVQAGDNEPEFVSWDYRVIRFDLLSLSFLDEIDPELVTETYGIYTVYYDRAGNPVDISEDAVEMLGIDSLTLIADEIDLLRAALRKPVLDINDLQN